ncbi:MAG: 50S ribosomal protein L3 N(5)-glutamine methyltransferase, partial [Burkholderiales bacterium]
VSELLRQTARDFSRARLHYGHGTHNAREEAAWLISSVLGFLLEQELTEKQIGKIHSLARRRIRERVPLAYLLEEAWLGEYAFYVDERVIVPRSFIAELLRDHLSPWLANEPESALDLCTGSGCLAVLLALTFPKAKVDAADLSAGALSVARKNINRYKLGSRVNPVASDLFDKLKTYDLIVTNPPYVTSASMKNLPVEYRREPKLGLAAGRDGLDLVHRIIAEAKQHLSPGGLLVCEIGGNRKALERSYPKLEFAWPAVSDPGTVFILQREQLPLSARASTALRRQKQARPA